jgi:DNA-binding transcriptional regulator YiaG
LLLLHPKATIASILFDRHRDAEIGSSLPQIRIRAERLGVLSCLVVQSPLQGDLPRNTVSREKEMPNIGTALREEILRLARKEIRKQTTLLRRASAQYRKDIAEMKRRVSELRRKVGPLEKQVRKSVPSQVAEPDAAHVRFTAKGLRSQRQRLALSAANYGKLIGVTGQTVYSWEQETSRPRQQQVAKIASLRSLGKREAQARLEQLKVGGKKKPK